MMYKKKVWRFCPPCKYLALFFPKALALVSTGLALPCPAALGTMLCSLVARVSAFAPSDTLWKKMLKEFTSAREKDPDQLKTSFHWFR